MSKLYFTEMEIIYDLTIYRCVCVYVSFLNSYNIWV